MSYPHGLQYVEHSADVQYETAAADVFDIDFPGGGQVEMVGAYITETADGTADSDSPELAVDLSDDRVSETNRTEKVKFRLTPNNVADDTIVLGPSEKFPIEVKAGGRVTIEVVTAGTATGAFRAFAYVRHGLGFRTIAGAAGVAVNEAAAL